MNDRQHPHPDCSECNAYLVRRGEVLPPWVVFYAKKRGMDAVALFVEFVRGVHRRHESGLSLATEVKR